MVQWCYIIPRIHNILDHTHIWFDIKIIIGQLASNYLMFMHFQYTSGNIDISIFSHKRSVLTSGPVNYLYVYMYSWECYREYGHHWYYTNVSSLLKVLISRPVNYLCVYTVENYNSLTKDTKNLIYNDIQRYTSNTTTTL